MNSFERTTQPLPEAGGSPSDMNKEKQETMNTARQQQERLKKQVKEIHPERKEEAETDKEAEIPTPLDILGDAGIAIRPLVFKAIEETGFNMLRAADYSVEDFERFLGKAKNPSTVALIINTIAEHAEAKKLYDTVAKLQKHEKEQVRTAALSYCLQYATGAEKEALRKQVDKALENILALDKRLTEEYQKEKQRLVEKAKKTGKGAKAWLLLSNPDKSSVLATGYSALIQSYAALAKEDKIAKRQLENILQSSDNPVALINISNALVFADQIKTLHVLLTDKNISSAKKNALLAGVKIYLDNTHGKVAEAESFESLLVELRKLEKQPSTINSKQKEFIRDILKRFEKKE